MDTVPSNGTGKRSPANRQLPPEATRFKPGQSGNPNGRPKKVQVAAAIAEESLEKAMRKLSKLINSDDEKVALAAAQAIIDRAMGKAKQSLDIVKKPHTLDEVSTEDLIAVHQAGSSDGATEAETGD